MATEGATTVPRLYDASTREDLVDWGVQPDAIEGLSRSSGRLVHLSLIHI